MWVIAGIQKLMKKSLNSLILELKWQLEQCRIRECPISFVQKKVTDSLVCSVSKRETLQSEVRSELQDV